MSGALYKRENVSLHGFDTVFISIADIIIPLATAGETTFLFINYCKASIGISGLTINPSFNF